MPTVKKLLRFGSLKENFPEIGVILAPVFVEQFFVSVCSLIVGIILGQVGQAEVAAYNLIENVNFLVMQVFLSIGAGTAVVVAQYRGRGDPKAAGEAAVQSLALTLTLAVVCSALLLLFRAPLLGFILGAAEREVLDAGGLFFTLSIFSFPFLGLMNCSHNILRGSGHARRTMPMIVSVSAIHALLSWIMVSYMELGILGAGLAIVISRGFGAVYGLASVRRGNDNLIIDSILPRSIDMAKIKIVLTVGVPAAIEQILFQSGRLLTQTYAISFGTQALAANSIANTIYNFINLPAIALQLTIVPLVGKYIGMEEPAKAKQISSDCLMIGAVMLAGISLIMSVMLNPFISLFGQSAEVNETLRVILISCMWTTFVFMPFSFILPGALRAAGDVKMTTAVSVISMFLIRVSLSYVLTYYTPLGVIGIWVGMYIDWVARSIVFVARFKGGKWLKYKLV